MKTITPRRTWKMLKLTPADFRSGVVLYQCDATGTYCYRRVRRDVPVGPGRALRNDKAFAAATEFPPPTTGQLASRAKLKRTLERQQS